MSSLVIEPMTLALIALRSTIGLQEWTNPLTTNKLNECMITLSHQGERRKMGKRVRMTARERESHLAALFLLSLPFHQDTFMGWDKDISFFILLFFHFSLSSDSSPLLTSSRHNNTESERQKDMGWAGGPNLELLSLSSTMEVSVDKALHSSLLQSPTHSSYSSKTALNWTEHIREGDINTWADMRTLTVIW